jgi:predicted O-linked N-acetylglucosamine transferase (SPINDLY family)
MAIFPKDNIVFFSRSNVPAKTEGNVLDTWNVPVEKVVCSLFVVKKQLFR